MKDLQEIVAVAQDLPEIQAFMKATTRVVLAMGEGFTNPRDGANRRMVACEILRDLLAFIDDATSAAHFGHFPDRVESGVMRLRELAEWSAR